MQTVILAGQMHQDLYYFVYLLKRDALHCANG